MKKFLALVMAFGLLISFSACGEEEQELVTIYIPATVEIEMGEGTIYGPLDMVFEKAWQNKVQFTVTYYMDADDITLKNVTTYGDRTTQTTSGGRTTVTTYDEKGRTILQTATGALSDGAQKVEATTEYDEQGRTLKKTQTIYYSGEKENNVSVLAYTYTDLVEGSEGVCVLGEYTYKLFYDAKYRCIGSITLKNGEETDRTEYTYDENGNMESSTSYIEGEQDTRTVYTYKKATVTQEKAEQIPMFVRAK